VSLPFIYRAPILSIAIFGQVVIYTENMRRQFRFTKSYIYLLLRRDLGGTVTANSGNQHLKTSDFRKKLGLVIRILTFGEANAIYGPRCLIARLSFSGWLAYRDLLLTIQMMLIEDGKNW